MFLCSSTNEDNTEGDIAEMGEKLSNEVMNFITENCPENTLGRLSFVGHSLGGLIIRSSLPLLEKYSDKMYTYISLSSP
jgi:predicted alpha/beta superfamily hydrolase